MKRTLTLISAILLFSGLYAQTWTAMGTSGLGTGTQKVKSIAYDPNTGTIYAGGDFAGSVSYIAKWNNATSQWENLGTGISGAAGTIVNAVCYNTFDHNLYVGGYFTTAGGIAVHNVAKWNGTAWSAVGAGIGTSGQVVNALYVSPTSQKLYACGTFANDGTGLVTLPKVALFDGAWVGVGTGLDGGVSAAYSLVEFTDVTHSTTRMYCGTSTNSSGIVQVYNGSAWTSVPGMSGGACYALASFKNYLFAGGTMSIPSVAGTKWDGTSWSSLGTNFTNGIHINAFWGNSTMLLIGGNFTGVGVGPTSYIGKITGASQPFQNVTVISSVLNGEVFAIGNQAGKVIAGGLSSIPSHAVARTDINIGIEEADSKIAEQVFYPNPMLDKATLRILTKEPLKQATLKVYDAQSKLLAEIPAEKSASNTEFSFLLYREGMRAGFYFYQVQSENEVLLSDIFVVQ